MSSRKSSKSTSSKSKNLVKNESQKLGLSQLISSARGKKKTKKIEAVLKDKDCFDSDDELSAMSMLSCNDARRKSAESDSIKASRKNKVFQHIKKEMEIRAKFKPVSNPAEQV